MVIIADEDFVNSLST